MKESFIEKIITGILVPVIIIAILMGCISVTFTAASQINSAVTELSGANFYCSAELDVH